MTTIEQVLDSSPFAELGIPLDQLVAISDLIEFEKDQLVFSRAQQSHNLYLVVEGSFNLGIRNGQSKVLGPGELFGEIGVLNSSARTGSVRAREQSELLKICGTRIFNPEHVSPALALKVTRMLARRITGYLISREQLSTQELMRQGEGEYVEFKGTLRTNMHTGKRDRKMENACLKSLAAFLNSEGGTLLVGVNDEGEAIGMEMDKFPSEDRMLLHLTQLIKQRLGTSALRFVDMDTELIDEQMVLRVDCEASTTPVYLVDQDEEHFYIRTGPSTTSVKLTELFDILVRRFPSLERQ